MKRESLSQFIRLLSCSSLCDREVPELLEQISTAAKCIQMAISRASLTNLLGDTGETNIQGERVQYLDAFADRQLTETLKSGGSCAGIGSEEKELIVAFKGKSHKGSRYVVLFDPLDGSSNLDAGLPVGTIFGIYRRKTEVGCVCNLSDFLQSGNRQVAAGYVLYGCTTTLIFATQNEVNGFTLDPHTGEFQLSHPHLRCPEIGYTYSVNGGYHYQYNQHVQKFIRSCQQPRETAMTYTQRYIGSMVSDLHRTLLTGGIFMYPATHTKAKGKLRLLYECNPLAFIMEAAGGRATNGEQRILDIEPVYLHEVTPIYLGSLKIMKRLMQMLSTSIVISG